MGSTLGTRPLPIGERKVVVFVSACGAELGRRKEAVYLDEVLAVPLGFILDLAQQFAEWVRKDDRFELAAPVPLNLVCFRHKAGDATNQTIMDRLNRSGDLFLTHTKLHGKLTLRLSVGQMHTKARHVEKAWERIEEETARL